MTVRALLARTCLLLALAAAGCMRYETVWSGVQWTDDGEGLELASDPGLCGCVTIVNKSDRPLTLRASFGPIHVGRAKLAPGQSITARFDWAGDRADQTYVIDAVDDAGRKLDMLEVLEIGEHTGSRSCANPGCAWGPLNMKVAAEVGPRS
jgi:hypothetical protein